MRAGVAQLVEQLIRNQQVIGSSPIAGSKNSKETLHRAPAEEITLWGDAGSRRSPYPLTATVARASLRVMKPAIKRAVRIAIATVLASLFVYCLPGF